MCGLTLTLVASAARSAPAQPTVLQGAVERVPQLSHVFFLIGENTSYQDVTAARAPYIVNRLKPRAAWLTDYSALHSGSTSDYIGLTSGQYLPCDVQDVNPNHKCHQDIPNLFSQLDQRGVSWKEWNESAANPCDFYDPGTDWSANIYGVHHNPALYYDNIEGGVYQDNIAPSPECLSNVVATGTTRPDDMSWFNTALKSGDVPRFNFVSPNDCQQGHDICGRSTDTVGQFDSFLAHEVPRIEASLHLTPTASSSSPTTSGETNLRLQPVTTVSSSWRLAARSSPACTRPALTRTTASYGRWKTPLPSRAT